MQKITYTLGEMSGEIYWAVSESFSELYGKSFSLGEMETIEIAKRTDLTDIGKILLSAVAGAVIQRLIDEGSTPEQIFSVGTMTISNAIIPTMPR